jgi:hypothetical protein
LDNHGKVIAAWTEDYLAVVEDSKLQFGLAIHDKSHIGRVLSITPSPTRLVKKKCLLLGEKKSVQLNWPPDVSLPADFLAVEDDGEMVAHQAAVGEVVAIRAEGDGMAAAVEIHKTVEYGSGHSVVDDDWTAAMVR